MNAARYAAMSDPEKNPNFRRRWDAPPLKVKRPPLDGTSERAVIEISSTPYIAVGGEEFKHLDKVRE